MWTSLLSLVMKKAGRAECDDGEAIDVESVKEQLRHGGLPLLEAVAHRALTK